MYYTTNRKINVRTLRNLKNGEGLTFRNGKIVVYATGWQVSVMDRFKCDTAEKAMECLRFLSKFYRNTGIWFENGIYYVDCSERISTKKEAVRLGTEKAQISIYGWTKGVLVYL